MSRLWRTAASVLLALCCLFVFSAAAAPTANATQPGSIPMAVPVDPMTGVCDMSSGSASDLLAVNRWAEATGTLHSRYGAALWDDLDAKVGQGSSSMFMAFGNFAFGLAGQIVEGAAQFCILDTVGGTIDQAAGAIGKAFVNTPLIAFGFGFGVIAFVVGRVRGGGRITIGTLLKKVLVVGLLSVMVAGATMSTTSGGRFVPGKFSPGWFVTTIDKVVSAITAVVKK